jgi:hypothetical protein
MFTQRIRFPGADRPTSRAANRRFALKPRFDSLDQRVLLSGYQVTLNIAGGGSAIAGESQQFTALADFQATDPEGNGVTSPAGFTATIIWGDGKSSPGQIENYPGQTDLFEVHGAHTYPDPSPGQYWATVKLTDPDGGQWGGDYLVDMIVNPPPNNLKLASASVDRTLHVTAGHPLAGTIAVVMVANSILPVTGLTGQIYDEDTGSETSARIVPAGPGIFDVFDPVVFRSPGPDSISFQLGDHQSDWAQSSDQIIAQAPETTNAPPKLHKLGAKKIDFAPGSTVPFDGAVAVVAPGGGPPPPESGVDWNDWYRQWIDMVNQTVFQTMVARSSGAPDKLTVRVDYTVFKNGDVKYTVGTAGGSYPAGVSKATFDRDVDDWQNDASEWMGKLHDPLPPNTKLKSISRSFIFSLHTRASGQPEIILGGPPHG